MKNVLKVEKETFLIFSSLILSALIIRVSGALSYYYHVDELMHIYLAKGDSLGEVWRRGLFEMHPPLGHFIRHFWLMFGDGIFWNRLLSITTGTAAIYVFFRIGKELFGKYGGIFLALIAAFSPIAVTYSISVRNYGLFLLLASLQFLYFFRVEKRDQQADMLAYLLVSFLACATHFSGFIITAGLGISLGVRMIYEKKLKDFLWFSFGHIPVFVLLIIFYFSYFAPGTYGSGWQNFFATAPGFIAPKFGDMSFPLRIMSIFGAFFSWNLAVAAIAAILFIYGLYVLFMRERFLFFALVTVLSVHLTLAVLNIFPLSGNRYCIYLLEGVGIPIAAGMTRLIGERELPTKFMVAFSLLLLPLSFWAATQKLYTRNNPEFTITKESYDSALEYLTAKMGEGDAAITNHGSALYLKYAQDAGAVMYGENESGELTQQGMKVLYDTRPYYWEYTVKENFLEFLKKAGGGIDGAQNVWFIVLGSSDYSMLTIMDCQAFKEKIQHSHKGIGSAVFALNRADFVKYVLSGSPELDKCFAETTIPQLSRNF